MMNNLSESVPTYTHSSAPHGQPGRLVRLPMMLSTILFALFTVLTACTTVQTTKPGTIGVDRAQRMSPLVSEAELNNGAKTAYAKVLAAERKKGALNTDARMTKRVRAISQRLIPQVKVFRPAAANWGWQVNVIKSDQVNAWCMPGGKIAFYSGIITKLKLTDDEIAAIMGHEIAHALREHSRERASEQTTAGLLIGAGAAAAGAGTGAINMTQLAYQTVFGLKHSRLHETEADRVGIELSARAGYNPNAAISLWQKMAKLSGGSGPEFLSTHPSPSSRVKDLRNYAKRVQPLYANAKAKRR